MALRLHWARDVLERSKVILELLRQGITKRLGSAVSRSLMLYALLLYTSGDLLAASNIALQWDTTLPGNVAGHNIYYGTGSGGYSHRMSVGRVNTATIVGLTEGVTYYFTVTAYDTLGNESQPAIELAYTVPIRISLPSNRTQTNIISDAFLISSVGLPVEQWPRWSLEASDDLKTWRKVVTGLTPPFEIPVVVTPRPLMYFRLRSNTQGAALMTRKAQPKRFRDSFAVVSVGPPPEQWVMENSEDMRTWRYLCGGTNAPINVGVLPTRARSVYFRLSSE